MADPHSTSHSSPRSSAGPASPNTPGQHTLHRDSGATAQIHAGTGAEPGGTPVVAPVHLSAAYEFTTLAEARERFAQRSPGLTYSRTGNPTVALFERRIAALEGGVGAVATASGQAALSLTLLALAGRSGQSPDGEPHPVVSAGHIVASERIYGGTADLLNDTLAEAGIEVSWVDPHHPQSWWQAITSRTRALLVESIGNPHADLPDIPALAEIAHSAQLPLIVDNTLASPHLLRPGQLGADLVVHSATKYLSGGGTVLGGAIVDTGRFTPSADPQRWPQLTTARRRFGGHSLVAAHGDHGALLHLIRAQLLNDLGPTLAPWNAQQLLEGIETLDVRMERHCRSTEELARRLERHPAVETVRHPSLPASQDAAIARRDFPRGAGAVLSFELPEHADVERFFDSLTLVKLAANLGDARTLACHPASMTHCRLSEELRAAGAITEQTVRLAVGREDVEDIWADLASSLEAALGHRPQEGHRLQEERGLQEGSGWQTVQQGSGFDVRDELRILEGVRA